MDSVTSHAQDIPLSVDKAAPEHSGPYPEDHDDIARTSLSQTIANVSQDTRLSSPRVKPQASALSPFKRLADVTSSQECSQAPSSGATPASSQQPSPEFLMSLGIKVRDFAYQNTLPAIVPVPRVPRQMQPAPLKRSQRGWDDKEVSLPTRSHSGQSASKKPRSLERKATEPVEEPVVQHTRTLGRITIKRLCSLVASPSRSTLQTTPRRGFSASPPTSPLMPLPSRLPSQESNLVQSSTTFPFIVRAENPGKTPTSHLGPESQPLHPVAYTSFNIDPHSSAGCSPTPGPPNASPPPLISTLIGLQSPSKDSGADPRGRGTPLPSNRYHLRQRPIPSSRASILSRHLNPVPSTSQSLPRRSRRTR